MVTMALEACSAHLVRHHFPAGGLLRRGIAFAAIGHLQIPSLLFSANNSGACSTSTRINKGRKNLRSRVVSETTEVKDISSLTEAEVSRPDLSGITEWELDFCSRPIVDERGKRIWELLICDSKRQLEFSRYFPNNVINSVTLKTALEEVMNSLGVPRPEKIRYFRSQMQTIISKACKELDIRPVPSQRCITLLRWLQERQDTVYSQDAGFQQNAPPVLLPEPPVPSPLPDNLRGEKWAFVQLPLEAIQEEIAAVESGKTFGNVFPFEALGIDLPADSMIPGVAVESVRAGPLAAWTNGLELASIDVDNRRACLLLSSGISNRWVYASYTRTKQAIEDASAWQAAKVACGGLHFLAVQKSLDSESCEGFWLLFDPPISPL